jgi:hypothetical protein
MAADIPASGLMMFRKEKEKKSGPMEPNTKENIRMVKNMGTVFISGAMAASSQETGKTTK